MLIVILVFHSSIWIAFHYLGSVIIILEIYILLGWKGKILNTGKYSVITWHWILEWEGGGETKTLEPVLLCHIAFQSFTK